MQEFEVIEEFLKDIRTLCTDLPNSGLEKYLFAGLYNAHKYFGMNKKVEDMEKSLVEIEKIAQDFDLGDSYIRLGVAFRNTVLSYREVQQFKNIPEVVTKAKEALSFDNQEHLIEFSEILTAAIETYGEAGKLAELDEDLSKLVDLYESNPHYSIKEKLLILTSVAIQDFESKNEKDYLKKWKKIRKKLI